MTFKGSANNTTRLYTNRAFTGVNGATYNIKNSHSSTLRVYVYKVGTLFDTQVTSTTVSPGATKVGLFNGLSSSEYYYLAFDGPSNFSGSVY